MNKNKPLSLRFRISEFFINEGVGILFLILKSNKIYTKLILKNLVLLFLNAYKGSSF